MQVASIMCSYNAAYGKPTCANNEMNNQMVRSDWGWDGFFVSDCTYSNHYLLAADHLNWIPMRLLVKVAIDRGRYGT